MNTVAKYPRTFHWPSSPEIHSDDKVLSNPEEFLNVPLVITEKLDGGCTALHRGKVYARSTGAEAVHPSFNLVKQHHAWKTTGLDDTIYGENLFGVHSIRYAPLTEVFWVFGVLRGDEWLSWTDLVDYCASLEMQVVPLVRERTWNSQKTLSDFLEASLFQTGALGPVREGFVIRTAAGFKNNDFSRRVCKYVRHGHVQTDEHWLKNWKQAELAGE